MAVNPWTADTIAPGDLEKGPKTPAPLDERPCLNVVSGLIRCEHAPGSHLTGLVIGLQRKVEHCAMAAALDPSRPRRRQQ